MKPIKHRTQAEQAVLKAWFSNTAAETPQARWQSVLRLIDISEPPNEPYTLIQAAVGSILVGASNDWHLEEPLTVNDPSGVGRYITSPDDEVGGLLNAPSRLVCALNWASSGPGESWPISYRLFFSPGFERYSLVSSSEDDELYGYRDFAIGHFRAKADVVKKCRLLMKKDWRNVYEIVGQERWGEFLAAGLVDEKMARRWAVAVWGREADEDSELW